MNYLYIKKTFAKPYIVVDKIIQAAIENKHKSQYIVSNEEWETISEESVFRQTREPINWSEFKNFIQSCEGSNSLLSYHKGKAEFDVMEQRYKDNYRTVNVTCHEYSETNGDHKGSVTKTLLMENYDGSWNAVGKSSEE